MLPGTKVLFETADPSLQHLFDEAERKCLLNIRRFGERPVLVEGGGYEKAWLETQPMGGEMYAKRNLTVALNNQLLFMDGQREDGRLPGSVLCTPDGKLVPQYDKFQGFCFPRHALNMWFLTGKDPEYLERLDDCLRRFDGYLWRTRDSDGDGLLESWCVYDTGEDNALRYGRAPVYWETDTPPENADTVPMASMDVTSYSYACRDTLARISLLHGDPEGSARWRKAADEVAARLRSGLWDEKRSACYDRDRNGKTVDVLCHNNLRCMYWGSFSQEMADRFIRKHLLNPEEFWTPLPLPSVAANDPLFRNAPENNWSGQCEGLTFQRAIPALERYGFEEIITRIGCRFLKAVIRGGCLFTQQYDPFTGEPSRVGAVSHVPIARESGEPCQDAYGPTLLAVLEYIAHIWGIDLREGEVRFGLGSGMAYTYEQRFGDRAFSIISDGKHARAFMDGKQCYEGECGCRVICDTDGNVLRRMASGDGESSCF